MRFEGQEATRSIRQGSKLGEQKKSSSPQGQAFAEAYS